MKPTFTRRLNPRWSALSIALAMSLSAGWAQTTNVIVHDTFDDGAGGFATRMDDLGASYGRDIQWRPRVSN